MKEPDIVLLLWPNTQLIRQLGCFHTIWGRRGILQFDPRWGSVARIRDLLIVLVLLDLISCNGGKQCHGTILQVDYSPS